MARPLLHTLQRSGILQLRKTHILRELVGPPDPVSNIRPVLYNDTSASLPDAATVHTRRHPYALDEFSGDPTDYQWRLERQRLDAFNHAFWTDSNTRFEAGRQASLSALPDSASPEAREAALSKFYSQWLMQEQTRQKYYTDEWRRRNIGGIILAARIAIQRLRSRFTRSKITKD